MKKTSIIFYIAFLSTLFIVHAKNYSYPDTKIWDGLLKKYATSNGKVNYEGFKKDRAILNRYLQSLKNNYPNSSWTKDQKLCYWINAYNAFTVQLVIDNYPVKSIKDIKSKLPGTSIETVWDYKFIKIGTKNYSLNDIEHTILREQLKEPLIHFAVVCASFSCPSLRNEAYVPSKIRYQLKDQTKKFLRDITKNSITVKELKLSKIFEWFKDDFTKNGKISIVQFLNPYTTITIDESATIDYLNYSWKLND